MDSSSTPSAAIIGQRAATGTGRTAARKTAEKEAALNRKQQSTGFEADRGYTTNQRLRLAGIVQSKAPATMMENRERNRAKGQIIRIHEKRVKRQQGLIEAKQFLIANTDANDPKQIKLLEDVSELHDTLQVLMQDLDAAEETAIEDAMKMELESTFLAHNADNDFIDLTIDQIIH